MFCSNCGNKVDEEKFCGNCGNSLVPEISTAEVALPTTGLKRFVNILVDTVVKYIIILFFAFLSGVTGSEIFYAIGVILMVFYYIIFETIWQRTIGKLLTKTKVVNRDGTKPKFWKIVGRSLSRMIPFEALSFLIGSNPIGWHDSLSGTVVVPSSLTSEQISKIDYKKLKEKSSNNTGTIVLIVIVGGLFMIAIIGILASVVLASMNSARDKAQDASIQANLSGQVLYAENLKDIYGTNSYINVCDGEVIVTNLKVGDTRNQNKFYVCNDSENAYAIAVQTMNNKFFCVDNTTTPVRIDRMLLPNETSCLGE